MAALKDQIRVGLDVGSTTLKAVVLGEQGELLFQSYERHFSMIAEKAMELLSRIRDTIGDREVLFAVSGSAGMGLADRLGLSFQQEVYATRRAVESTLEDVDTVIELGGEDAKILFLRNHGRRDLEVRMNGSCAGGTGAFIDQMATLLGITPGEMNDLAAGYDKIYSIASRCGVFAKSDIQPLLNQGAKKENISASIFAAVVNQTIAGLALGRKIEGRVVYLGGPLSFLPELRKSFDRALGLTGICPPHSLYYVALGAAQLASSRLRLSSLIETLQSAEPDRSYKTCRPLFESEEDYQKFTARHERARVRLASDPGSYEGPAYLGVDAGSTTVKAVLLGEDGSLLYTDYRPNGGNPVPLVREFLQTIYERFPHVTIAGAASTGYGEEMIKNAFCFDTSLVETMAHYAAAKEFQPDVDFIIDIGGQDIKCFKIRGGTIDDIFLNEACSSGCGSFLQTFAGALGYPIEEFSRLGLFADHPVDLGSRCTVFMNSSVKQAQKDGATIENISAGLSVSVVKNALYKVIRAASADSLGQHIVVQGGTFLNDAVLRAFEQEIGREVIRPNIAGLMGAYGAALHARRTSRGKSQILDAEALKNFRHEVQNVTCQGCQNHCSLTVNTFSSGRRFIGGNRCEKPTARRSSGERLSLYRYKRELLAAYRPVPGPRGKLGIPMGLNLFELYPFFHTFFTALGFEVLRSPDSSRELYLLGQDTISSDTACYPAKLMHGHIQSLIDEGVDTIFYPCMTYNIDEGKGTNHFNCPVVAYYPEVIRANMPDVKKIRFLGDYLGLHSPRQFEKRIYEILHPCWEDITRHEVKKAARLAYQELSDHLERIHRKGAEYLKIAREQNLPVIVLAGRPYHIDPEINHGIPELLEELGAVVLSEDSVAWQEEKFPVHVLNQWTYHARLYAAAKFVAESHDPRLNLVQLVSFGCGVDAITTDEVRSILEEGGKIYTQIKIDEITNLGAVRIRLRSLFAALGEGGETT